MSLVGQRSPSEPHAPRRVVLSGLGVVSGAGCDLSTFWRTLEAGACQIRPLTTYSVPGADVLYGAPVELAPEDRLDPSIDADPARARCLELGLAAARRAMGDAGLLGRLSDAERAGVVFGTTLGEERQVAAHTEAKITSPERGPDPGFWRRVNNHRLAAVIAREHGMTGPALLGATACSSGNTVLAMGADLIAAGEADIVLAGGADTLTRLMYCGFRRMGALSKAVCRPFDKDRDGVSFGEGAGAVVLEELEHARRRGARIYCELAGYGVSNDAHHITAPGPEGEGFVRAMRDALERSGLEPGEVSYVSAHGTGTPYNDLGECHAMRSTFGEHAAQIPISSIKSMIGHTNGAAAALEAVACALAIQHQQVPPTANLETPEPGFDLDFVPGRGRSLPVRVCLSLAAGFGGANACIVLKGMT